MNKDINHIDSVLNSLEGMQQASPLPGLYERVMHRMQHRNEDLRLTKIISFISRPAVAAALIGILVLLNVLAVVFRTDSGQNSYTSLRGNTQSSDYSASLADYSYETSEP